MLIYTNAVTPRLNYIGEFAGKLIIGKAFDLTTDSAVYKQFEGPKINYSPAPIAELEFHIIPHTILFETGVREQHPECGDIGGRKAIFRTGGEFGFDPFAAAFYLISRYEEYLPHQKDTYGRFAHVESIAFREGFLDQPLVNQWIHQFGEALQKKFPTVQLMKNSFQFLPTYDIDIAWSYLHKGFWRNAGGVIRSLFTGKWAGISERMRVLRGKQRDPFDAFGWMNGIHEKFKLRPYYFFLLASRTGKYDKNISPKHSAMHTLISDQLIRYPVGAHPSWQSGDDLKLLREELAALGTIIGKKVDASRQHYIRLTLPDTYRILHEEGIRFEFSMGYGSINGFRASVASPFYWYDIEKERQTDLMIFPYCFMEANSYYEQKVSAQQALEEMRHYEKVVRAVGGLYIMIWHNSFLGTDKGFVEWKRMYEGYLEESFKG